MILTLVISCTTDKKQNHIIEVVKGIKEIKNSNTPENENFKIEIKKEVTINGEGENSNDSLSRFSNIMDLDADTEGNIYVCDAMSSSIKKFDKDGNFVKSIGRLGKGPGEFEFPTSFVVLEDTLYLGDHFAKRMIKYDTDGNFIENIYVPKGLPQRVKTIGKDKFIGFVTLYSESAEGTVMDYNLEILDKKFQTVRQITKTREILDINKPSKNSGHTSFAVAGDNIFISKNSVNDYEIKLFDLDGNLLSVIKKNYRKTPYTDKERKEKDKLLIMKNNGGKYFPDCKDLYKTAINDMFYDKYDQLWVSSSFNRNDENRYDFMVDVFKKGVFVNQVKIDMCKDHDFRSYNAFVFRNGKIYVGDTEENSVKVFSY
jgi:hypothetical protein